MSEEFTRPGAATTPPNTAPAIVGGSPAPSVVKMARATKVRGRARRDARSSGRGAATMLGAGLLAVLVVGGIAVSSGAVDVTGGGANLPARGGGATGNDSYGYYHEKAYDAGSASDERWDADLRSRSQDPNEAGLGNTSRWDYDGPYQYGTYGSEGMKQRHRGVASDPIASNVEPLGDVFESQGPTDPSGGQPVGAPPSSWTSPYYDAYAPGYTNPYANRIRMSWGEGYGAGAASELTP